MANSQISRVSSSIAGALPKKKLGRPRKSDRQKSVQLSRDDISAAASPSTKSATNRAGNTTTPSQANGARGATRSMISGRSQTADAEGDEASDEEEVDATQLKWDEADETTRKEEEVLENDRRKRLEAAFTPDQDERYAAYRRSKFKPAVLRKIVNQTVSQSVGPVPLHAMNIYTKMFTGEIVERARRVQMEWAEAYDRTIRDNRTLAEAEIARLEAEDAPTVKPEVKLEVNDDAVSPDPTPTTSSTLTPHKAEMAPKLRQRRVAALKKTLDPSSHYEPNPHRGLLTPDHLREGLRRYKADGEGGGVGFAGMSHHLLGVGGSVAWRVGGGGLGGGRLFR